jgi:predicted phage-related endonuclease
MTEQESSGRVSDRRFFDNRYAGCAPFECHEITSRESWLEMRKKDITASVAGCLVGHHDYITPYGLWALKSGLIEDDQEENESMARGRLLEPVAIEMLREEHQGWEIEANKPVHYYRDAMRRIGATPDAFVRIPERKGFGVIQVKTTAASVFYGKWKHGHGDQDTVPEWIRVQALVEAHLTGASWAMVAVLVIEPYGQMPLHLFEITSDPGLIVELRHAARRFWTHIDGNIEPEIDYARDATTILTRKYQDTVPTIDLSYWNEGPALATEYKELAEKISSSERRRKEIRAEAFHKMGGASVATFNGREFIVVKTVTRNGHTVKGSHYQDVRFKNSDDMGERE